MMIQRQNKHTSPFTLQQSYRVFIRFVIKLGYITTILSATIILLFSLFASHTSVTYAQETQNLGKNFGCAIPETSVKLQYLATPAAFLPIIPNENCSTTPEGDPIPLSPVLFPQIAARLFGFIASLIFYLLFFVCVISGIMWTWSGIDGKSASQAKTNFRDAFTAIVVVVSAYALLSTILGIISPNQINTDLNTIFYNRTK